MKASSSIFGLFLICLAGGFFYFSQASHSEIIHKRLSEAEQRKLVDDEVQYHLSAGSIKQRQNQVRVELQNQLSEMQVGNQLRLPQRPNPLNQKGVDHTPDRHETTLQEDLKLNSHPVVLVKPSEEVEGSIREENWQAEQWEEYKKAYVRDYLAAARDLGYELKLSQDLTILSVRKIQKSEMGRSGFMPRKDDE